MKAITRREAVRLFAIGATGAMATSLLPQKQANAMTWSGIKSETWGGVTYYAQNGVEANGFSGTAQTRMTTSSSVPANNLCCVAKLTDGAGLVISSNIAKNAYASTSVTSTATGNSSNGFQSRGHAYTLYYTHAKYFYPAWPSARTATRYDVNGNGQTYGTILQASSPLTLPDLIAVRADNGLEGYSYREEMYPLPQTVQEAAAIDDITEIPVYLKDGVTVVGAHTITHSFA